MEATAAALAREEATADAAETHPELVEWLEGVKVGYGRFAASLAQGGWEDVDDLRLARPADSMLESLLGPAGAC